MGASTTMNENDKDTQMTMISPMNEDEEATPEPNSPKQMDANANEDEEEEEKDPLYNDLAPKQNVAQQLKSVVDNVPDQNKIVNPESLPAYSQNLKADNGHNQNYDYLKSTLKKQQRAWVDPWE